MYPHTSSHHNYSSTPSPPNKSGSCLTCRACVLFPEASLAFRAISFDGGGGGGEVSWSDPGDKTNGNGHSLDGHVCCVTGKQTRFAVRGGGVDELPRAGRSASFVGLF